MPDPTWRYIRRKAGTSEVAHLVTIDHRYGPSAELEWVVPLCKTRGGRGLFLPTEGGLRCHRCAVLGAELRRPEVAGT